MLMLNEKSSIDCDELELEKHSEEIEELMEKLIKLEDYDCVVLHKYIDLAHKDKEMKVIDSNLWDIYELVEYADFKNGVDILIDDEGFLNLSVYGQTYRMDGNDYFINSIFKIIPRDKKTGTFLIYLIFTGRKGSETFRKAVRKKKSTIELLNEYKGKVDKINSINKEKEKRGMGEER